MAPITQVNLSSIDPKTWSRSRKEMAFAVIVFGSCACGAIGPLLVPGFTTVATDLGVTLTQVTLLNGSLVMALGVSAYVANALATAYGTRLIFLATTLALIATCCWGAAAKSYGS
jgi:MFS family permease